MKGIINQCAIKLVIEKFGEDKLQQILSELGLGKDFEIIALEDYPDQITIDFIMAAAKVLKITPEDVMIAFGDYWVNEKKKKKFRMIFAKNKTAKELLMAMDSTHVWATQSIEGSKPPHFEYEELDENTLIMHYFSERKLEKILEGLIKGVFRYYKQDGSVTRIDTDRPQAACAFKITFKNS